MKTKTVSQDTVSALRTNANALKIGVDMMNAGEVDPVKVRELMVVVASLLLLIAKITPTKVDDMIVNFIVRLLGLPIEQGGQ